MASEACKKSPLSLHFSLSTCTKNSRPLLKRRLCGQRKTRRASKKTRSRGLGRKSERAGSLEGLRTISTWISSAPSRRRPECAARAPLRPTWPGYPHHVEFMRENLYERLGWPDLKNKQAFRNTCAIRMSVVLASAHVPLSELLTIKTAPLNGKSIKPGQAKLSWIVRRLWGAPETSRAKTAHAGVTNLSGVVHLLRIDGLSRTAYSHMTWSSRPALASTLAPCPIISRSRMWSCPLL